MLCVIDLTMCLGEYGLCSQKMQVIDYMISFHDSVIGNNNESLYMALGN
jgi:hypothetical protein